MAYCCTRCGCYDYKNERNVFADLIRNLQELYDLEEIHGTTTTTTLEAGKNENTVEILFLKWVNNKNSKLTFPLLFKAEWFPLSTQRNEEEQQRLLRLQENNKKNSNHDEYNDDDDDDDHDDNSSSRLNKDVSHFDMQFTYYHPFEKRQSTIHWRSFGANDQRSKIESFFNIFGSFYDELKHSYLLGLDLQEHLITTGYNNNNNNNC